MAAVLPSDSQSQRRETILDAAERCFVAQGFHRSTMQDLARVAGMSVGNLYRYFPSKDAVVLALAERDRAEAAQHLGARADAALWSTLAKLLRHHLVDTPRAKAVLRIEVWAEGTRNPTIAAMLARFAAENDAYVKEAVRRAGWLCHAEVAALAERIQVESQGITVSRALSASYDPEPAVEHLIADVEARLGIGERPRTAARPKPAVVA